MLQAGTLIYVRVVKANPGMNPELSCTDGWLGFLFLFLVDVPHKFHGSDFLLVSQGFLLIWYFCLSLLIKKKKIFLSIP